MTGVWSAQSVDVSVPNVDLGDDSGLLQELWRTWRARVPMNEKRSVYYDGEAALQDFGISLPPQMAGIESALGWTAKGVHALTNRSQFEGFVDASGSEDPFDLAGILSGNHFEQEFKAARVSSAVHGVSFLTVTRGAADGEPEILILAAGADRSAALWDRRSRSLRAFLTVGSPTADGAPEWATVYTREAIHNLTRRGGRWVNDRRPNPTGVVTVVPLVHGYELRRPLGHSRITRASMGYSDSALRTIVRAEVSAEFYSAPEYYLFGAGVEEFIGTDRWSAIMGRIKALDTDSNDSVDKPDLHRFSGASPQPHTDQLRMWANLFADDQDLEVKFADASNPSSADAIFAAKETLITGAKDANSVWARGAVQAMRYVDLLRGGGNDMSGLRAQFTDPAIVSPSARADAFSKLSAAIPGFGTSEVGMEFAGLSREQINRFMAEQRRAGASSRIAQLVDAARGLRDGNGSAGAGVPGGDNFSGAAGSEPVA